MQTEDGQQYGPVARDELDRWVEDGRIDATCQLLCEGWEEWKWAEDVYPQLSSGPETAGPSSGETYGEPSEEGPWAGAVADVPVNPYTAPRQAAATVPASSPSGEATITPAIRRDFNEARPWVMILSILGFIIAGLGAIASLAVMAAGAMKGVAGSVMQGFVMLAMTSLPAISAYFLFTFGGKLTVFLKTGKTRDLEHAMSAQKSFWKVAGIVACVGVGLQVLGILAVLLALVAGGAAVMSMPH